MLLRAASSEGGANPGDTGPIGTVRPLPRAPLSARQVEERTQILAGGTPATDVLTCQVHRDSAGRVRIEWRIGDGDGASAGIVLDPVAYLTIMLLPGQKAAYRDNVARSDSGGFQAWLPAAWRTLPKGRWKTEEQALGVRVIVGIEVQGTRWVRTSEEQPSLVAFRETWSSQALGLTLEEKTVGPNWSHTIKLHIQDRSEPAPVLFIVPPDYTVREN